MSARTACISGSDTYRGAGPKQPGLTLVAAYGDGAAALDAIREERPDVAVLDHNLPGLAGREVIEAIAEEALPTRALVLSGFLDPAVVHAALAAGAAGYVSKDADPAEIVDAVVAVGHGDTVLSQDVQAALAGQIRRERADHRQLLTAREVAVLRLLAEGLSAARIGKELSISATTVKTHLQHAYDKLGVSSGAAAVTQAIRRGILQ
jgi:two-component system, NarL family, nitrate/nitrite response regulator NarL